MSLVKLHLRVDVLFKAWHTMLCCPSRRTSPHTRSIARLWERDSVATSTSSHKIDWTLMSYLLWAGWAHVFPGSLMLSVACSGNLVWISTLQVVSISEMALRLRLAVAITSSCWTEFPAATALAVAMVMPFVMRMNSSGVVDLYGTSLDWNIWHDEKAGG